MDWNSRLRFALLVLLGCLPAGAASAQEWAEKMFDHTSHDFGAVARGAEARHVFRMKNIYLEDVHIADIQSSCGCTKPTFPQEPVKTYQTAEIVATLDTRSFLGRKEATLKVKLDQPFPEFPAEVQLHVYAYIRSDVVVQPGVIQFGSVKQGQSARRNTVVSYAGRNDWKILRAECPSSYVKPELTEVSRQLGRVTYDLSAQLAADAPPGYVKDAITLVTDDPDPQKSQILVNVEAAVVSAVSVGPSPLVLGIVGAGQKVSKNLVVRAQEPFRVLEVTSSDKRFHFSVPDAAKPFQIISVSFAADQTPGPVKAEVSIRTDLAGESPLRVAVHAQIAPKTPADPKLGP